MQPERYADVADVVVRGEPEALGARLFAPALAGVVEAGFVDDLDALPFPDWSAFPIARYKYALLAGRGRILPVSSARGCAYGCGYCPFRVTAPFRERRAERVVEEVRRLKERHGVRAVAFRDPLFNLDRDRARAIARGLLPLDVRFSAEMRADRLDEALLRELRDAGLRSLEMGVESVDVAMLAREKRRPPAVREIEHAVETAHRLGVRVIANFLFGLPDDREETIRETVAWAKRLNTFAVQFTVATPYPGTTLEARVRDELVTLRPERFTGWEPLYAHPSLSADRLRALREWAYVSYHARPRYVASFARQAARAFVD
jgi:anaerobic magnesium-protoporphyrin IX monomethyl ester cyclase